MKYPEHEKLKSVKRESEIVQSFIDWLFDETNMLICEFDQDGDWYEGRYPQVRLTREQIMAQYFDIDLQKLSEEKDAILDDWRKSQELQ